MGTIPSPVNLNPIVDFTPEKQYPSFSSIINQANVITTTNTAGNLTYTAAQILGGFILRDTNGSNRTDTLPTAASLVPQVEGARINTTFDFEIRNTGANTITVAAGTGGTTSGTMTIATGQQKRFRVVITATGERSSNSPAAYVVYSMGTVTF